MSDHAKATKVLQQRLGAAQVILEQGPLYEASMDNLRYSRLPSARIYPESEEAVETVLRLANEFHVPVTARGAGSATTGATTPSEGGWVLDLSRWKAVQIDPVARMAFVQPGVTIAELDAEAGLSGLTYPVDPGSAAHATVGGTIATNAGGMRGAKYGVTRDYVLALEGFMASGDFVRWGANLRKFSAGYNIRDLWIGSEGTLGIITGAVLRLLPCPEHRATCLAVFPSSQAALTCSQAILSAGLTPSALEFLDPQTVGCTFALWRRKDPETLAQLPDCLRQWAARPQAPAVLLIEADGSERETDTIMQGITGIVQDSTQDWIATSDARTAANLWKLRRSCSQAMFELAPRKLNEDVVVPFAQHQALLAFLHALHLETGLPTPTFGHAADGNFHAHVMFDDADPASRQAAEQAVEKLMRTVVHLGGAISGEHGIGLAKAPFFSLQHGPAEIQAMQAIKDALDPHHILNPGKLWNPSKPWAFPRESVKLPWDH